MRDAFDRPINSLRISVTQKCNFNCFFCHQEGEHDSGKEMSLEEITEVVKLASNSGIRKIKLTGGEPLIRDDIVDIVRSISPMVDEVSMTTNASLLEGKACDLREAGLARVNISLHTLKPSTFQRITASDYEIQVKRGIEEALRCGLSPVKLNMVVMKSINSEEISDLIEYSIETGAILQLIEFQELENGSKYYDEFHYDLNEIEDYLEEKSKKVLKRALHHRKVYHLENGAKVEVVRPMHNSEFCAYCTRLRLTSDGKLKACLMRDDNLVSFVDLIRSGESHEKQLEAFKEAISRREPYWRE
ncbi:GTP 3',8-cyclase MoaA [Candidatus Bathyarchaeota archaeon]|nr:GTP 3',8-cyclase MoaA [Candidatus Bathyarchaeota archaeon]